MKKKQFVSDVQLTYQRTDIPTVKILSSFDAVQPCIDLIPKGQIALREFFGTLLLNRTNHVLNRCLLSSGGSCSTVVDIKHLMQYVILSNAVGIVLFHNHPSGNVRPSAQDCSTTRQIKEACRIFDINLLDHIILSGYPLEDPGFFSFSDNGML